MFIQTFTGQFYENKKTFTKRSQILLLGMALFSSESVPDVIYILKTKNCDPILWNQLSQPFSGFVSKSSCDFQRMFQPTNYYESFGLKVKAPFEEITIFDQNIIKKTEWMTFLKNVPNSSNSFNFTVFWILLTFCWEDLFTLELTFLKVLLKNIKMANIYFGTFANVHNHLPYLWFCLNLCSIYIQLFKATKWRFQKRP